MSSENGNRTAKPNEASDRPVSLREAARGLRVLVVDDEPDMLEILVEQLRFAGAEVESTHDATVALRLVRDAMATKPFDFLLTDTRMPKISGIELIREIRTLVGRHPRLFLMGADHPPALEAALLDGFFLKPFRIADVLRAFAATQSA